MPERYACLEIRTSCGSCGQSVPVNGPYRKVTCPACFHDVVIDGDIIAGFLNDFEEECQSLARGQGQGGTLMSGSGTFKYGYWSLPPRCSGCKKVLELPGDELESDITCPECGRLYHAFPAPSWLVEQVPSAALCVTSGPVPGHEGEEVLEVDESSSRPVVMSCPKCAGALSVSSSSERIMECGYCSSEVYVPDEVWKRLHPVRTAEEWFVGFQGKNIHELRLERRRSDEEEEKEFLRGWKIRNAPRKARRSARTFMPMILVILALAVVITIIGSITSEGKGGIGETWSAVGPFLIVPLAIGVPVWFALRSAFSSKIGKGRISKNGLAELAAAHNWKHEGAEYGSSQGYVDAKYRGRDIEIHPDDDYAIEVELNDSIFYLKTEPPGYPGDEVQRFTTGDYIFDERFPIRYARADFARRMESSEEESRKILAPLRWFLQRWGGRIGRMSVDWSSVGVHLTPGHLDIMDTGGRYIKPEDLEPLLEDMMVLASALDAVAAGRDPELK